MYPIKVLCPVDLSQYLVNTQKIGFIIYFHSNSKCSSLKFPVYNFSYFSSQFTPLLQARQNDNFFFHIHSFTLQFGNCLSVSYLIRLVSPYASEFIPCICSHVRVVNMQLQMTCLLMISVTRCADFFFPQYYSRINHIVFGNVSKGLIIFVPLYLQFVLANACGLDSFCSRNLRQTINLLKFTSPSEYNQQVN